MVEFALMKKKRRAVHPPVGHFPDAELASLFRRHAFGLGPQLRDHDIDHVFEVVGAGTDDVARVHGGVQLQRFNRRGRAQQRRIGGRADCLGHALQRREIALPFIEHRQRAAVAMEIQPLARQEALQGAEGDDAFGDHETAEGCASSSRKRTEFERGWHMSQASCAQSCGCRVDISAADNYRCGVLAIARRNSEYPYD
jgi:hypothetical protein